MRYGWMVALFALAADPAVADITARFSQAEGPPIVIQVNDRGDSRVAVTDGVYVSAGGVNHMILTLRGTTFVVRQEDFLAVVAEFTALRGPAAPANGRIEISERGRETVGGRSGTVFALGEAGHPELVEFVVSTDSDLAPVGRAFQAQFLPILAAQAASAPGFTEAMSDLFSRGAPIRFGELFRLEAVETSPVPLSAFALPSAPISREAFRERLLNEPGR